jgi:hypothetical protein
MAEQRPDNAIGGNGGKQELFADFAAGINEGIEDDYNRWQAEGNEPSAVALVDIFRRAPSLPGVQSLLDNEHMVWAMRYVRGDDNPTAVYHTWLYANEQLLRFLPSAPKEEPSDATRYILSHADTLMSGSLDRAIAIARRSVLPRMERNSAVASLPLVLLHTATSGLAVVRAEVLAERGEVPEDEIDDRALEQARRYMEESCGIIKTYADPADSIRTKSRNPLDRSVAGATNLLRQAYHMAESPEFILEAAAICMPLYFPDALMPAFTGNTPLRQRQNFQQRIIVLQGDLHRNGLHIKKTLDADREALLARAQEYVDLAITDRQSYIRAVDDIHARIRLTYFARKIVDAVAAGTIDYGQVLRTAARAEQHTLAKRANQAAREREVTIETDDTMIVVDELVPFTILAPDEDTGQSSGERTEVEIRLGRTKREIDPKRVIDLIRNVAIPWGAKHCRVIARSLREEGQGHIETQGESQEIKNLYYLLVMKDTVDGREIEHCVGDHPTPKGSQESDRDAIFLFDGRRGIDPETGEVLFNWDPAMRTKRTARRYGAERVLHTKDSDPYKRILDRLLAPLQALPSIERRLGLQALLASLRSQQIDADGSTS